jgi:hypothetical protein
VQNDVLFSLLSTVETHVVLYSDLVEEIKNCGTRRVRKRAALATLFFITEVASLSPACLVLDSKLVR